MAIRARIDLAARSSTAQPVFSLPNGAYFVHAAYGFASQMKRVVIADKPVSERLALNAGAVEVTGLLGDTDNHARQAVAVDLRA